MSSQIASIGGGVQLATEPFFGSNNQFSLDSVLQSRAVSLTGMARQMNYWSDSFFDLPGGTGSDWRVLNAGVHVINTSPGGIFQQESNAGYGGVVIDPLGSYPFEAALRAPSFVGVLSSTSPFYLFARFRVNPDPGTGGPGGWDIGCSAFLGLVDSHTLGVVGVGINDGGFNFSAVGGDVLTNHGTTGVATQVPLDFSVWHDMEIFSRFGHFWVKIDDREAVDCTSICPGTVTHGTPLIQIMSTAILQPCVDIDHMAIAVPGNRPALTTNPAHPYP